MADSHSLLSRTTCPHCWSVFAPEDVLWVAAHDDLLGDPRLGRDYHQRFLPTRFDLAGNALDARGLVCTNLACPRCHLPLPRALLETEPAFVSILGTPACGKSFFLATLTWELRRVLSEFTLSFADADPAANRVLADYEEQLFLNPHADDPLPVKALIRKTVVVGGDLYDTVRYGGQEVSYPRPFLFALRPGPTHPRHGDPAAARVLCLYDNAGESFQPGADTTRQPVTQHLTHSRLLLFLFDPTQDVRFRALCARAHPGSTGGGSGVTSRQESVLLEAATRVRRLANLPAGARINRPLLVVCTKFDAWCNLLDDRDVSEPWVRRERFAGLDVDRIEGRSDLVRRLLLGVCPEVVHAAEGFSREVRFIPVSALGLTPVVDSSRKELVIRPRDVRPRWAAVPLLYGLWRCLPGLVPAVRRKQQLTREQPGVNHVRKAGPTPKATLGGE